MPTLLLQSRLAAFLDLIAQAEGTSSNPATLADGYDIIVSGVDGRHTFTDYSHHPFSLGRAPILVRAAAPAAVVTPQDDFAGVPAITGQALPALHSTASGRYQITLPTWETLTNTHKLGTFSPQMQDLACLYLLDECKATAPILSGDLDTTIDRVCETWASFPGNLYSQGGRTHAWLLTQYQANLQRNGASR